MSILLLLSFLFFLLHPSPSSSFNNAEYLPIFCDDFGTFTANSTYETNLNQILFSIPTYVSNSSGFSKNTFGFMPDQVFALALCRGDTNSSACISCLDVAIQHALRGCPYYKSVTIYFDFCHLSYSNQDFLSSTVNSHLRPGVNDISVSDITLFDEFVNYLMNKTADSASYTSSDKVRYSTAQVRYDKKESYTIFALEQCTPDLFTDECRKCLGDLITSMTPNFSGRLGAGILGVRCTLRYDVYTFYDGASKLMLEPPTAKNVPSPAPTVPKPETPASPEEGTRGKRKLWIIVTATSLASLFCFSLLMFLRIKGRRRAREQKEKETRLLRSEDNSSEFSIYNFSQIADATNHFSPENKLGEGGFGSVYKGQLPNGVEIAAKRLSTCSGQGLVEFKNEIQLIANLQHRNLVSLIGCCIEGEEKILIYEYMPNKSLDFFLFDQTRGALSDWNTRFHITEGIAQGLLYLHKHSRLRIIHRDLKASNILLDQDMNPKISDFGMARIFGSNVSQANTNRVVGTYGYMSPEYAFNGVYSIKSDVFSFGVLLLEIVSGKKNTTFHQYCSSLNLLNYTWELWNEGKWIEIIDASLGDGYSRDEIKRCIHTALMCVQENPTDRPTMSNVVAMLSSENSSFPVPKQPAFFNLRTTTETEEMLDIEGTSGSVNNITITIPCGR